MEPRLTARDTRGWSACKKLCVGLGFAFCTVCLFPFAKDWAVARFVPKAEAAMPPPAPPAEIPPTPGAKSGPTTPPPPVAPEPRERAGPTPPAPEPLPPVRPAVRPMFKEVEISEPFQSPFARNKVWMDSTGVHVVVLSDRRVAVVCVTQAKLDADTAAARLDAEKVCRNKMAAELLKDQKRVTTEVDEEREGERLRDRILVQIRGEVRVLPPVGRWTAADGSVYYMAFGKVYGPGELP